MTARAVESLQADSAWLLEVAPTFTTEEWEAPSDCEGWRVQDVVAHLTQVFRQAVDPGSLPAGDPSGLTERNQDRYVDAMRDLSGPQVLEQYRTLAGQAIPALQGMQGNDMQIPMGDLGQYPLHMIANAFAFDHYTHLRVDLLRPSGPIDRPAPASDELRLEPTLDWLLAGLPQMTPDAFTWLDTQVNLVFDGATARTVHVTPVGDGTVTVAPGEASAGTASVHTDAADFVVWSTKRRSWRELDVRLEGLHDVAERFCDSVRLF